MNSWTRIPAFMTAFLACAVMGLASGCASGGFKLTRQYAGWVNRQHIIVRIILYVLGFVVFIITLVIDAVIFNTVDFWEGRVSAGDFEFKEGGKTYFVKHEYQNGGPLRQSTIRVVDDASNAQLQEIVLHETPKGEIELFIDGRLRTRVENIAAFPVASIFDSSGALLERQNVLLMPVLTSR